MILRSWVVVLIPTLLLAAIDVLWKTKPIVDTVDFAETGLLGPFYRALARERSRPRQDYGSVMVRRETRSRRN